MPKLGGRSYAAARERPKGIQHDGQVLLRHRLLLEACGSQGVVPARVAAYPLIAAREGDDVSPLDAHGHTARSATGSHGQQRYHRLAEVVYALDGDVQILLVPGSPQRIPQLERPPRARDRPAQGRETRRPSPTPIQV
jgi:hypothetical protein